MFRLGRNEIFLFVFLLATGAAVSPSTRERSFVGTWRVADLPVGQATPFVCGRECTITLDRQKLVVRTREETNTYLPGKPIRTTIGPSDSNMLRVETITAAAWDNSTLVITRTANVTNPYDGQVSETKFVNRLTVEGDRLAIRMSRPVGRSGAARSEFTYRRVSRSAA